jgi:hypothetical protein
MYSKQMRLTMKSHAAKSVVDDLGDRLASRPSIRVVQEARDNPLAFRTIRDVHELEALRAIWNSWPGTRDSDLDFFSSMVRSRGSRSRPHVIVLTRNARPDAILIGLQEQKKIPCKLSYFTIYAPKVNVIEFVYGGLRGNASEENCAALVREVMRSLDEGDADLALWEQLSVQSSLYNCALRLPCFALRDHARCLHDRWLMNFPKGLDTLFMNLGRSQRSKLRRKYRNVLDHFAGKVRIRCFRSLVDLEPAISDMEAIASKTDKRRIFGGGFFDTPQIREQMVVAAKRGWLRIYILYLEEKPAAFWMGTIYDHCLQADQVGYDPVWGKFSPGIFLFLKILEDLQDEDIKTVDFGWRDIQIRRCFGDLRRVEARVHIYAPTARGIQLNLLSTATHCAIRGAKFLVRRTHCLEWARRVLLKLARQRCKHSPIAGCQTRADAMTREQAGHAGGQS